MKRFKQKFKYAWILTLFLFWGKVSYGSIPKESFTNGKVILKVEVLSDRLIHFEYGAAASLTTTVRLGEPFIRTSPLVKGSKDRIYSGPTFYQKDEKLLQTRDLKVEINLQSVCLTLSEKLKDHPLTTLCPFDLEREWKGISIYSPMAQNIYGLGQYFYLPGTTDGDWMGRVFDPLPDTMGNQLRYFNGGANSVTIFPVIYALGEGKENFALFIDSVYKQMWSFNQTPFKAEMWGDTIRFYLLWEDGLKELRTKFMDLTGHSKVPPKKMFGLWTSEFGYDSWEEIDQEIESLEKEHFPFDGFALDIQWFGGKFFDRGNDLRQSKMGTLRFDEENFPRAKEKIDSLKRDHNVELMAIEESYLSAFLPEHAVMKERGFLARECPYGPPIFLDGNPWWGVGGMIDWTNPEAGNFWHEEKRKGLSDLGITAHWTDLGEPEAYSIRACYHGFPEEQKHEHKDIHNIYNLEWIASIWRGYEKEAMRQDTREQKRPFILSRSGGVGIGAVGAAMWSGDIAANMGALSAQQNVQMHMSLVGVDYYGSDVGGFHRRPDVLDGDPQVLYTEWLANSVLFDVPVRPHTWNLNNDKEVSPSKIGHRASNLANLQLRYRLIPYYYSLAFMAYLKGDAVIAPLFYEYQEDENVRKMGGQKLIGPMLMAATFADYNDLDRKVYFPKDEEFINYYSLEWIRGEGRFVNDIPVFSDNHFQIPLFARNGAIIPLYRDDVQLKASDGSAYNPPSNYNQSDLLVLLFQSGSARSKDLKSNFSLFEDGSDNLEYLKGLYSEIKMASLYDGRGGLSFTISRARGNSSERKVVLKLITDNKEVSDLAFDGIRLNRCITKESGEGRDVWNSLDACYLPDLHKGQQIVWISLGASLKMKLGEEHKVELHLIERAKESERTNIFFLCYNGKTRMGESIYITGNISELGEFNPQKAIKLDPSRYPTWSGVIELPSEKKVEWKCLKRVENGSGNPVYSPGNTKIFTSFGHGKSGKQVDSF